MIKDLKVNKDTRVVTKSKFDKIGLGIQNDNEVDILRFSFDQIFLGQATLLTDIRDENGENIGIPMVYNELTSTYDLNITKEMLSKENITFQLQIVNDDMIWHSKKTTLPIFKSLVCGEGKLPPTLELWLTNADKELYKMIESEKTRNINEEIRENKELVRQSNEESRIEEEQKRVLNENVRISNENNREEYIANLKQDVENGFFDGKDYILTETDEDNIADKVKVKLEPDLQANLKASKDYTDNSILFDIKNVILDKKNYIMRFIRHDDTEIIFDLPIEFSFKDGYFDYETSELVFILMNDKEIRIPAAGLNKVLKPGESSTIQLQISNDGTITASIKGQCISKTHLTQELQDEIDNKVNKDVIATSSKLGLIKSTPSMNFSVNETNGYVISDVKKLDDYKDMNNNAFLSKGTNENIKNNYVKEAVQSNEVKEELHNQGFVKSDDYPSVEKAGLIKNGYSFTNYNGSPMCNTIPPENIESSNDKNFVSLGTMKNFVNPVKESNDDNTDRIKRLENDIFDSGEAEGTSIHIEDSTYAEAIEIGNEGVSNQKTTKGVQLIDFFSQTSTSHVSVENDKENNKITLSGDGKTGYQSIFYDISTEKLKPSDVICFWCEKSTNENSNASPIAQIIENHNDGTSSKYWLLYNFKQDIKYSYILPADISSISRLQFSFYTDNRTLALVEPNTISITKPILYLGDKNNPPEYEEYTGTESSPNPDYPQDIEVMESGTYNIYTCGNNFIPTQKEMWESGHYDFYGKKVVFSTRMRLKELIPIIPGTTYKVLNKQFILRGLNKKLEVVQNISIVSVNQTFTTNKDVFYLAVSIDGIYDEYDESLLPIIKLSDSTSDSSEYIQSKETFTIPEDEFVGKIDKNIKDYILIAYNEEDRKYHLYLEKNVGKLVITKNSVIALNQINANGISNFWINTSLFSEVKKELAISNYLISQNTLIGSTATEGFLISSNAVYLRLKSTRASNVQELKNLIDDKEIIIYGLLAEPYVLDLGITDMPLTFTEITNVFSDHPLQPNLYAKHYRDFKKTIKELQDKVQTLETDTIKNTDYATTTNPGIIRVPEFAGLTISEKGSLFPQIYTLEQYEKRDVLSAISKGTLEAVLQPIRDKLEELSPSTNQESEVNNDDLLQE